MCYSEKCGEKLVSSVVRNFYHLILSFSLSLLQAELEAFENRLKGRRKNKRKKDEIEVEQPLWQKYKNVVLLPVCGIIVLMIAWFLAYNN